MAYGSARYSAYQKKNKGVIVSEVQSSRYGQKNTGSALGYIGGNFAAGLGGIVEGLSDLFVATGSLITGDVDYAKYVFKDNVVGDWHESITDDYNPGKVMQFLGDVSHGLGQSSVFLLDAVGVPVGTVGFFGGMIGQGISGAAAKTGDVGFKEVAYGTLSGAAEGALEKAMGGMSKLAGNLSSSVVKNTTKTAVRKGLFKQVLSDAASEFGEEFLSEYVDVALQRVTGVDKQASTTLKNAIYSGFVGAVSGAVSAGAGDIAKYSANQRNGAKIIASGNAQTLVNTATAVADKMAAQGTDFKKAAEWVKALRAEVDAYNKLTPEAQQGARGQTILGEMQASLYFAETQAVFNGVQVGIQNADEEKRAALAEYVNLTVDKSKRSKDYTAEDVAKNTDNIAWQLSVLHYANHIADLDAVMAQEEAVQGVIREEQGAQAVPDAAQAPTVQVPQTENNVPQPESVTVELSDGDTLTFREAKQPLPTHEEKLARAKERAEKWKSFEEKTQASAQEMNLARSYVKNFDDLDNRRRSAILETVRSAKNAGTKVDEVALRGVVNLMSATRSDGASFAGDLEVRFADGVKEDGLYTRVNGKPLIVIDAKAESNAAMRSTVIHELVHYVENKQGYKALADYVMKTARPEKKDAIRKEYEDFYKENNIAYTEAELESEVVASLVGERLQSEKFLKRYAEKDASVLKKAQGFIKELTATLKDKGRDKDAEAITADIGLRFDRALAGGETKAAGEGKKYSFAGKKAETADKIKLATAEEMIANGVDSETVRRETGWFKGYDGKWRFEIDDSDMEYSRHGFNPDYLRYKELELKFLEGTISDSELQELQNTPQDIKDINLHRFDQFVKHKALFAAYPELKRVRVSFDPSIKGNGAFYPATFSIKINPKADDVRKTLLHEIQHAVQYTEGLTGGADVKEVSPDVKNRVYVLKEEQKKVSQELEAIYKEIGFDKYSESLLEKAWNMEIDPETIESLEEQFLAEKSRKGLALYNYQKQVIEMVKEAMQEEAAPYERYRNTAGEIEARDVANRADMTAEERKNTRPDIDREDVVFADGFTVSYFAKDEYDEEIANIKPQLRHAQDKLNTMEIVFSGRVPKKFDRKEDMKKWAKSELKQYGYEVDRQGLGKILFPERAIDDAIGHIKDQDEILSIIALFRVLKRGVQIAEHGDHKKRQKHTITIAAPIEINGVRGNMGVVVNLTNNKYYVHRVIMPDGSSFKFDIKKDTNQEMRKGVPEGSLADATRLASTNSIPQKSDLSTDSEKKYALKKKKGAESGEAAFDEHFAKAEIKAYERDAKQAQNTAETYKEANKVLSAKIEAERERYNRLYDAAMELQDRITFLERKTEAYAEGLNSKGELLQEARKKFREAVFRLEEKEDDLKRTGYELEAFKSGNRALNRKLAEERETNKELRQTNKSLARQIAQDAYEEDAKIFTQKEIDALIERIGEYSTDKFRDIMNEKSAEISKADKEQFAYDIYVAFHVAAGDKRAKDRIRMFVDRLAHQYLDNVYFVDEGKRTYLKDAVDDADYKGYLKTFRSKIYRSFEEMGRETTHARLTALYRAKVAEFEKKILDSEAKGKNLRELQWQAKRLRETVAAQKRSPQDEGIYNLEKEMARIADERGRVSAKQADKAFDQMHVFLTSDSGKVDSALEEMAQVEGESMISLIEEYKHQREKSRGKYLNSEEMALAAKIIAGGYKIIREYNRVYYNGHWEDMGKLAAEEVDDLKGFAGAEKEYKTKIGRFLGETIGKTVQQKYFYNVLSPETVVEALEGYRKDGVLKTLYHTVREATQKSEHMAVKMKKPFAEYLDDKANVWQDEDGHKHSFRDKLNKKVVVVNGNEITLGEAIYLYMLMKRKHSHLGLKESGFVTYDEKNQRKLKFKILDIDAAMGQIANQLDGTDKAFLKMAETFFNETATKIKYDADMKILGYTNNQEGYYVPIIRDRYSRMANVTDKRQSIGSIATVYNKSFNQKTVENQKALEGKNIMAIINDHADGLADYSELYLPLKSFDRVYNTRVITDRAEATSIRETLNNQVWNGSDAYFKKLFADIQGQGGQRDTLDDIVGKLRSGWVNSVLGLNLKVVATQTTSFVAANQVIEMKYLAPALAKFVGDASELGARADEYSDIIEARSFEMGALRAQGNIDKVTEWASKSGFMINLMDRRVCLAIFHAAELKAEAEGAGSIGTEENARAAAKIADEVIYTTQAMTSQAERSALQRSKSEIAKTFAMFTSDSVKQLSHFYGNVMKYMAHRERAKTDPSYEAELKKDAKAVGRSATTLVATGAMLGIITQAFKYLYAKEEEEPEEKAKDFAIDMISSTFNILPIVSDVMDKFVFGYDMSLNVLDIANDTIEDTSKLFDMAGKAMSGEFVSNAEVGKNVIGAVKTYATFFGVPIAPVERTVTGLLRRFTPSTIYGYDAMFSNPSYTSDLKAAVESGDERLAEHILVQLYKSEATGVYTSDELSEVARLYGAGYTSVIPQRIGNEINGVKLNRTQRKQFEKVYSQASGKVNAMMATEAFADLTDEAKAKAIKNLYSLYYNRASAEVTGAEWSNAQAYSRLTSDMGALFVAQAYKGGVEAYVDSEGREITVRDQIAAYVKNLGLSESDEIVMLYALGYRDKTTKASMLSYINSLSLTDEEKAKIAEKLGFDIVNGAVSLKVE